MSLITAAIVHAATTAAKISSPAKYAYKKARNV
jgi:hypothetical protein